MSEFRISKNTCFLKEDDAFKGVIRVMDDVRHDIFLITGETPDVITSAPFSCTDLVICGTVGRSSTLDRLDADGRIDLSAIKGKREVYSFQLIGSYDGAENVLVIAGSDKRGTIYGLYHLSEVMGVSPLVNWNHVYPKKRDSVTITDDENMISHEPSVKYRGFFINDEWPAFGNWATEHFGDVNAECYAQVFELLLRLKGNYLWPAMWKTNFSLDGPGLASAELADELGVVMSTSHHEPCMRTGEEYTLMRGKDSPYGDAWSFITNREGITNFWRDGLIRNRDFENVITMGMRGERDTPILGRDSTLEENIALLRDVLKTQNRLIRENVNEDLEKVPRQIVFFTEVESFFYGNEKVKGLMGDPETEGVTLVLSDNNNGFSRTLPTADMCSHKGGYGMYYHLDMHGGPFSYEWISSAYLPRIWEQMTQAYEYGVREIWVANVGDIGTQEYGLSYFLDLAYDIDKWGGQDSSVTQRYTDMWIERQFGAVFPEKEQKDIIRGIIWDNTQLLERVKHECMTDRIYHPLHFGESEKVLAITDRILSECENLKKECPESGMSGFISLLYYPACATANLMKLWLLAGRNRFFAHQNRTETNLIPEQMDICVERDRKLVEEYHTVDGGKYYGFGLSEHIGFTNWNEEDNKYPIKHFIYPANKPRMLASRAWDENYMTGLEWTCRPQIWNDAMRGDVDEIAIDLACASAKPFEYRIHTDCPWIAFSKTGGTVSLTERITLFIRRELFTGTVSGTFEIENVGMGVAKITLNAENADYPKGCYIENDDYIAVEAEHFSEKHDTASAGFRILSPYGKTGSGIKSFPVTADHYTENDRPSVSYDIWTRSEGEFLLTFCMAPTFPVTNENHQYISYSVNDGDIITVDTVKEPDRPFFLSPQYYMEAGKDIKETTVRISCKNGCNRLTFYACSPNIVLERLVLVRDGKEIPESFLGPVESYIVK
ncbi:MAG: glycosyl hydrolase 115 family protein [Oscillospiraceae bacterium]|nr:glycosyl hydrolase 115 family protein [Oscillospiraceae bacterium]